MKQVSLGFMDKDFTLRNLITSFESVTYTDNYYALSTFEIVLTNYENLEFLNYEFVYFTGLNRIGIITNRSTTNNNLSFSGFDLRYLLTHYIGIYQDPRPESIPSREVSTWLNNSIENFFKQFPNPHIKFTRSKLGIGERIQLEQFKKNLWNDIVYKNIEPLKIGLTYDFDFDTKIINFYFRSGFSDTNHKLGREFNNIISEKITFNNGFYKNYGLITDSDDNPIIVDRRQSGESVRMLLVNDTNPTRPDGNKPSEYELRRMVIEQLDKQKELISVDLEIENIDLELGEQVTYSNKNINFLVKDQEVISIDYIYEPLNILKKYTIGTKQYNILSILRKEVF